MTQAFPLVTVLPYTVGMFRDFHTAKRVIHAGVPGVPDRIVLLSNGEYIFFDSKTGNARLSKSQNIFKKRLQYCTKTERVFELRNVSDALKVIEDYERRKYQKIS